MLPGRGEHAGVYERFGRRLANDAYAVHALDISPQDSATQVHEQVAALAAEAVAPLVLAGSDTGALRVLQLVQEGIAANGLILAALPNPDEAFGADRDWDWELAARTTCPAHRARLDADDEFRRGALTEPIPSALASLLDDAALRETDVPALVLHGGADPIAPVDQALSVAGALPRAEIAVIGPAPHDVLNDATHRTVAAQVVQWLERLRGGPELAPIIKVLTAEPVLP